MICLIRNGADISIKDKNGISVTILTVVDMYCWFEFEVCKFSGCEVRNLSSSLVCVDSGKSVCFTNPLSPILRRKFSEAFATKQLDFEGGVLIHYQGFSLCTNLSESQSFFFWLLYFLSICMAKVKFNDLHTLLVSIVMQFEYAIPICAKVVQIVFQHSNSEV